MTQDNTEITKKRKSITERAERLVRQEVHMCLSSLVHTLAQGYGSIGYRPTTSNGGALMDLCEQAFELSSPVLDYEEAARQEGWEPDTGPVGGWRKLLTKNAAEDLEEVEYDYALGPEDVCIGNGIDAYEWEIFEHWAVSEWFGRQLAAQGERVDFDFANMVVWGRTTTGQGIAMDAVVLKIAAELNKEIV